MTQLLPPKKEVALALLQQSNVDIYLDPRAKGVVVPPQFKKEPRLILKIGLNMPVPIPDLRLDDDSMSCTLSFSRTPFYCVVPWSSVFAMVGEDGRGMVWPDDVPHELAVRVVEEPAAAPLRAVEEPAAPETPRKKASKKKKKKEEPARPVLVAVRDNASEAKEAGGNRGNGARRPPKEAPRAPTAARPVAAESGAGAPSSRGGGPVPSRAAPSSRPKRELPPYLRVVK